MTANLAKYSIRLLLGFCFVFQFQIDSFFETTAKGEFLHRIHTTNGFELLQFKHEGFAEF